MPKARWFVERKDGSTEGPYTPITAWKKFRGIEGAIAIVHPESGLRSTQGNDLIACPKCGLAHPLGIAKIRSDPDEWRLRCNDCRQRFVPRDQWKKQGRPRKYKKKMTSADYSRISRAKKRLADKNRLN